MSLWNLWGEFFFGIVIGWITYRTLAREDKAAITDIAAVVGAIAGAAVIGFLKPTDVKEIAEFTFGPYCLGLALGFFGFLFASMFGKKPVPFD